MGFYIGIDHDSEFNVKGRIIGKGGKNMKDIVDACNGTKLRLRGRGSGFLEGPRKQESTDPLMLCVSSPDAESYQKAKVLISKLMNDIYADYLASGLPALNLSINIHEGKREGGL